MENENFPGFSSPFCSSIFVKSMLRPSTRTGVPVFILSDSNPRSTRHSVNPFAALSPMRPPPYCFIPIWMTPFKKVPLDRITAFVRIICPMEVLTPVTQPFFVTTPVTISCQKSRFWVFSSILRHSIEKSIRSFCARGLHMAGPLDVLSMRNWIMVLSVTIPEYPPRASISRTICPLAIPPMAGLHDICAMFAIFMVISNTDEPRLAAAAAASQPEWPAPTTMISYSLNIKIFG